MFAWIVALDVAFVAPATRLRMPIAPVNTNKTNATTKVAFILPPRKETNPDEV